MGEARGQGLVRDEGRGALDPHQGPGARADVGVLVVLRGHRGHGRRRIVGRGGDHRHLAEPRRLGQPGFENTRPRARGDQGMEESRVEAQRLEQCGVPEPRLGIQELRGGGDGVLVARRAPRNDG